MLQAKQQQAVEEVHAGANVLVVLPGSLRAQFDDVGQYLVIHLPVVGKLVVLQQSLVRLFQLLEQVLVDLKVSTLAQTLTNHHLAAVFVPFFVGSAFAFIGEGEAREVFRLDAVEVQIVGAQNILYLPEIEEMLNTTFLTELLGYFHDKGRGELENYKRNLEQGQQGVDDGNGEYDCADGTVHRSNALFGKVRTHTVNDVG